MTTGPAAIASYRSAQGDLSGGPPGADSASAPSREHRECSPRRRVTRRITGGNDKQGFPMVEGVMKDHRVRLLVSEGSSFFRTRRPGDRKRKSIRGCIVSHDIAMCNLVILTEGESKIEGLTDTQRPNRLGPSASPSCASCTTSARRWTSARC